MKEEVLTVDRTVAIQEQLVGFLNKEVISKEGEFSLWSTTASKHGR